MDLSHSETFFCKALYPTDTITEAHFASPSDRVTMVTIVNGKTFRLSEKFSIREPRGNPNHIRVIFR